MNLIMEQATEQIESTSEIHQLARSVVSLNSKISLNYKESIRELDSLFDENTQIPQQVADFVHHNVSGKKTGKGHV